MTWRAIYARPQPEVNTWQMWQFHFHLEMAELKMADLDFRSTVGRCRLTRIDRAWLQHLKLKYDEPLSNFAINFNLCPYITEQEIATGLALAESLDQPRIVGLARRAPHTQSVSVVHHRRESGNTRV